MLKRSGEISKSSSEQEAEEIVLDDSSEISTLNTTTTKRAPFKSRNKSESVQGVTQSEDLSVANDDMDDRYGH